MKSSKCKGRRDQKKNSKTEKKIGSATVNSAKRSERTGKHRVGLLLPQNLRDSDKSSHMMLDAKATMGQTKKKMKLAKLQQYE